MKLSVISRYLLAPALIAGAVAISTLIPEAKAHFTTIGSYPATVCPGALGGASEKIALPAKNLPVRVISGKTAILKLQKSMMLAGSSAPIFVGGNSGSEVAFETIPGSTMAVAVCGVGGPDQWFLGGSAGVTSQSVLEMVNSGLSDSNVQIFPFNSKAALAPIAITIKANSDRQMRLASIVPGDESIALHIVTNSGRVTSFLLDHRRSGLKDLGASFISPVDAATKTSYIAGLYGSATSAKTTSTSMMRFLVPGNVNANVHLTIFSGDGTFTPIGFDSLGLAHQRVIDVRLPTIALVAPFGIEISSDQPVLAATLTQISSGGGDFAWANQLTPISRFRINLGGAKGKFLFIGDSLAINAQWTDSKGRSRKILISGNTSALWSPGDPLGLVTFTPATKRPIYGGAILLNATGGLNYLPLLANQLVRGAHEPIADIRTLTRN